MQPTRWLFCFCQVDRNLLYYECLITDSRGEIMKKVALLISVCLVLAVAASSCRFFACTPDPNEIQRLVAEAVKATIEAMPTATPYPTYTPVALMPTYTPYPTPTVASGSSATQRSIPPTPTSRPGESVTYRTHIVVAGDTLSALAKQYGTTVEAIVEANDLEDPSLIVVGQVLNIPVGETGPATPTPTGTPATPTATPTETPTS